MIISHQRKFIFIKVPKTAGQSIKKTLNNYLDQAYFSEGNHEKSEQIKEKIGEEIWSFYFKFAFVRNPWDVMVSRYFYVRDSEQIKKSHPEKAKEAQKLSFKEWIKKKYKGRGDFASRQHSWIMNGNGEMMVDFVGRFENLQEDFNKVCDKIGIKRIKLPQMNKSNHKHYSYYYNEETKNMVEEMNKKDVELFGYEFVDKSILSYYQQMRLGNS